MARPCRSRIWRQVAVESKGECQRHLSISGNVRTASAFKEFYENLSEEEGTLYISALRDFRPEVTTETLSAALEGINEAVTHADVAILLIAPHQHSPILMQHINESAVENVIQKVEAAVGCEPYELSADVTAFLREATICEEFASFWLSELGKTLGDTEVRVVETFEELCRNLPARSSKLNRESEANIEKPHPPLLAEHSAKQPDFKIFTVRELQEELECGFGELKPSCFRAALPPKDICMSYPTFSQYEVPLVVDFWQRCVDISAALRGEVGAPSTCTCLR
ncbi:hypothetical protein BC832DRAFT_539362 [Gaertneriomyces semiglobifer]|nr:hypothetical protein BC832DRAFT_539362 [Gaertneriomyces semiglobifer]